MVSALRTRFVRKVLAGMVFPVSASNVLLEHTGTKINASRIRKIVHLGPIGMVSPVFPTQPAAPMELNGTVNTASHLLLNALTVTISMVDNAHIFPNSALVI
jgi:hypothetical protein